MLNQFKFLYNLCLQTSIVNTDSWKTVTVTPLFKTGSTNDPGNYRPIVCIPLPGKILEKCIYLRLYNIFEHSNQFSDYQFGFRKKRSTHHAIFKLLDDIYHGLNNKQNCIATYIDLRKTFDTVNHSLLLNKVVALGLSENAIDLFTNYLTKRKQCVFCNETLSEPV